VYYLSILLIYMSVVRTRRRIPAFIRLLHWTMASHLIWENLSSRCTTFIWWLFQLDHLTNFDSSYDGYIILILYVITHMICSCYGRVSSTVATDALKSKAIFLHPQPLQLPGTLWDGIWEQKRVDEVTEDKIQDICKENLPFLLRPKRYSDEHCVPQILHQWKRGKRPGTFGWICVSRSTHWTWTGAFHGKQAKGPNKYPKVLSFRSHWSGWWFC